ncbi:MULTISPECIES: FkbM family methyltransferase [unclassified Polynucleobacter]|uniref:FkbM family methyltransferase n=1 Tax=unclassified Polynucleobacter TaxID=2640945 RepID=UPI002572AB3B|nr:MULTISPECIES: FkbM family methyltransferase [unclassified Polynucleobacter]
MLKQLHEITRFILNHPLTKQNKRRALIGFLRWQIAARLLRKKVIVPWVEDASFITAIGETGLTGNLYTGFMEYEDMLFLLHALRPDEIFVDVGANIGAFTILASKVVKAKSISFEPLPDTVDRLKDQIQINRINNVVSVRNKGVGDKTGALFFTNNNDTINKVSLAGNVENTTKVEVTTLDEELDNNAKYFFKIDVEGFEYNVIQGGKNILSSQNTIAMIIELNGSGDEFGHSNQDIHNKIISLNFTPIEYEPLSRTIHILNSYNKNGGNTIYVKDIDLIKERCKAAPRRCVHTANDIYI